jgi:hypothetical protein
MRIRICLVLMAQLVPAAAIGYLAHCWTDRNHPAAAIEDLSSAPSFSEITNAKSAMRRLSFEFMSDFLDAHVLPVPGSLAAVARPGFNSDRVENARRYLEEGLAEFHGTEQESVVVRALLGLFSSSQDYERWLDLYLKVLYEHPTNGIAGLYAAQAVVAAKMTARQPQLLEGFDQLRRIPFEFAGRQQINGARIVLAAGVLLSQDTPD